MRLLQLLILLATTGLTGCVTFDAPTPTQFAKLDESGGDILRAVNPQGVVYRVRTETTNVKADLAYWREALTRKLEADGYTIVATRDLTVAGQPGAVIEAVAPVESEDYGFLVALTVTGDQILVAEGAGERVEWAKAREGMLAAASSIKSVE